MDIESICIERGLPRDRAIENLFHAVRNLRCELDVRPRQRQRCTAIRWCGRCGNSRTLSDKITAPHRFDARMSAGDVVVQRDPLAALELIDGTPDFGAIVLDRQDLMVSGDA